MNKRKGIFYFRKKVPSNLRKQLDRHEFFYSLKTKDPLGAALLYDLYDKAVKTIIRNAKLEFDFDNITTFTSKTKFDSAGNIVEQEKSIDPKVISTLRDAGLDPAEIAKLVESYLFSDVAKYLKSDEHIQAGTLVEDSNTLQNLVDAFCQNEVDERDEEVPRDKITRFNRLLDILGAEKKLLSLSITNAARVRERLLKLPVDSNKYNGNSVSDVISFIDAEERRKGIKISRLCVKHVNTHLSLYSRLFKYGIANKLTDTNIFDNIKAGVNSKAALNEKIRKKNARRIPFSDSDLSKIFSSDLFTNFASSRQDENCKYWMPLIGLYTGARISQIASLDCDDIKQDAGIWLIDFNISNKKKSSKNIASIRTVPIHSFLLGLGLVEFSKKIKAKGHSRLFPELTAWSESDGYSRRVGDWFKQRYLIKKLGFSSKINKSFHSFRSTLFTNMRKAGVDEPLRNRIIGWSVNDDKGNEVVREHYTHLDIVECQKIVEKINFSSALSKVKVFEPSKAVFGKRPGRNEYS